MSNLLARLRTANAAYASTHDASAPKVPAQAVALVTCMDARVDALAAFGFDLGDAHVIRNAGAIVTDDVERSILLSQYTLGTRTIVVAGHTDCGLLGHDEQATLAQVEAARGARPAFALGSLATVEAGVADSVQRLRASAYLKHTDDVHGLVFDVATGLLRDV